MRHCRFVGAHRPCARRRTREAAAPAAGSPQYATPAAALRAAQSTNRASRRPARRHREQCARTHRLAAVLYAAPSMIGAPRAFPTKIPRTGN
ncbi:hypothetical protein BDAG_01777 [Burkholderia dolosa AU0158]|nr:hypothetical protein BDAG_01777 [Burkholderia dolosa AU0158]